MDKRLVQRAFLYGMSRFEIRLRAEMAASRNELIKRAAKLYEEQQQMPTHLFDAHTRRVSNTLQAHYWLVIPYFGKLALKGVKSRRYEKKASDDLFMSLIQEWIVREGLRKAKMIADTDRDDIMGALRNGVDEGEGSRAIASRIRKVSQLTPHRAATIARTETHAAATFGSIESSRAAERELGVKLLKEWVPTIDGRTRPEHLAMASHPPIPLDEKFNVGGELMDRPGDPSGSAENVIACRCTLVMSEAQD